jgi:hypothetical protein
MWPQVGILASMLHQSTPKATHPPLQTSRLRRLIDSDLAECDARKFGVDKAQRDFGNASNNGLPNFPPLTP